MVARRLALLAILTVCGVSCLAFAIIRYLLYKGATMTRKTWDFIDVCLPTLRGWIELLTVLLICILGFASMQLLMHHVTRPPCGSGQPTDHCAPQPHPRQQSWDQENLHELSNRPCPAVYDAPNGNLRECL